MYTLLWNLRKYLKYFQTAIWRRDNPFVQIILYNVHWSRLNFRLRVSCIHSLWTSTPGRFLWQFLECGRLNKILPISLECFEIQWTWPPLLNWRYQKRRCRIFSGIVSNMKFPRCSWALAIVSDKKPFNQQDSEFLKTILQTIFWNYLTINNCGRCIL
jgi:hypothetical protein